MDPKIAKAALEALKNGDAQAALALLEQMITEEISEGSMPPGPPGDAGATTENADAPPAPGTPGVPPPEAGAAPDDKQKKEMAALSRELVTLSGRSDAGAALAYFRGLHESAARTAEDSALLEAGERRELVAELVKLGVEVPALAWKRDSEGNIPDGDKREPVKRLSDEPIAELRSRVTVLRATRGMRPETATHTGPKAPPTGGPEPKALTKLEREYCEREKITPEQFHARKNGAVKRSK
jgi:hypothetical protein